MSEAGTREDEKGKRGMGKGRGEYQTHRGNDNKVR